MKVSILCEARAGAYAGFRSDRKETTNKWRALRTFHRAVAGCREIPRSFAEMRSSSP
jgi:hypothetical protein